VAASALPFFTAAWNAAWSRSVLAGVGFGEVGDRLVELAGAAEVGGQGDAVAGAGVLPGQGAQDLTRSG
jgi:hypothetical protein